MDEPEPASTEVFFQLAPSIVAREQQGTPLATTADEGNTRRIARIGITTAVSPSCEGLIDGRARGHWRDRASFPAAGDGGVLFIIYVDLRRLIYV